MKTERYIPALSYDRLTPFYDTIVRLTTRESAFKKALVKESGIEPSHRVLDLACGTGTLAIQIKKTYPRASVTGLDGDPRILQMAREKTRAADLEIQFDEGLSFALPYADASFDRVLSSLFFHHLTRANKLKTLGEVKRVLRPAGELHIADWGRPANFLMKASSRLVQMLDGFETTSDNFEGLLPDLINRAGFERTQETLNFNTVFGTIRFHKAIKK